MRFQPYPYQQECLDTIAEARRRGKDRALVVMASGLGKTVTAALDAKRWLERHGGKLLYLCHQNDILEQACETFRVVLGEKYTSGYYYGWRKSRAATCLFASFQTMREQRRRFDRKEFDYIVVDESHHGPAPTYRPSIEYFQPKFLLGITATPERTDLKNIREIYGEEIYSLTLDESLARGLLTPVDYYLLTDRLQGLEFLENAAGKISLAELNRKLFIPRRDEEIVRIINQHAAGLTNPRVMIFCQSVQHCDRLHALLPNSYPVHYHLPRSTQRLHLEIFRRGDVNTILAVDKFNEGIDVPEANVIVFLRATSSRMVFLQQLGRGLRRAIGKDRVLILDFVANCERLQMVQEVWKSIAARVEQHGEVEREEEGPFKILDIANVQFTAEAKRLADILTAIREGYTKEILVRQLQELARNLGRTPIEEDVNEASKMGKCASIGTLQRYFGSFTAALEAAGLQPTRRRGYPKGVLISQLQQLAAKLGKTPTAQAVNLARKRGECTSSGTFSRAFGSFNAALEAAGLRIRRKSFYAGRDRQELCRQLQALQKELGRTPLAADIGAKSKEGKCASHPTFKRIFGSFNAALKAAGFEPNWKLYKRYSREELLDQLKRLARRLKKVPTTRDIVTASKQGVSASPAVFTRVFGSWRAAVKVAGLSKEK